MHVLAENLLLAVRRGEPVAAHRQQLARLRPSELAHAVGTDAARKAFWINLYNAFAQLLLTEHRTEFAQSRTQFFGTRWIEVAGYRISLNDVEHGVLRRSKIWWSLGYLPKPFPSAFERRYRVKRLDARIHFALNCGAVSCPPIAFYDSEKIDAQLDLATASFLESETRYDAETNTAHVSRLLLWYLGDFGGVSGIRRLLETQGLVPAGSQSRIRFRAYDWSLALGNFHPET
jgi:hypothetical protein